MTRKILLPLLITLIVISCKKNDAPPIVDTSTIRLKEIAFILGATTQRVSFKYNSDLRITEVLYGNNNATPETGLSITYSGNEMILKYPPTGQDSAFREVRFTLNELKQPVQRIEHHYFDYRAPNNPIRFWSDDTLKYTYSATGLPIEVKGGHKDSTWNYPATGDIKMNYVQRVIDYTSSNGNITNRHRTENHYSTLTQNGALLINSSLDEEIIDFDYSQQFANKMDFSNATLLQDLGVFYQFEVSQFLKNLPNKVIVNYKYKDLLNGNSSTSTGESQNVAGYKPYGFVESIITTSGSTNIRQEFNYTR